MFGAEKISVDVETFENGKWEFFESKDFEGENRYNDFFAYLFEFNVKEFRRVLQCNTTVYLVKAFGKFREVPEEEF